MMNSGLNHSVNVHVIHNPRGPPGGFTNQSPQMDVEKRPISKVSSRTNHYVYVNSAFAGSVNSINGNIRAERPTSVVREQYWACSKWPLGQRILAITVGVLVGTVIGLAIVLIFQGKDGVDLPGFFRNALG